MESEVLNHKGWFQYLITEVLGCHNNNKALLLLPQGIIIIEYLVVNKECILSKRHFQCACNGYLCSHLAHLADFSFVKKENIDISKIRANPKKWMTFSDWVAQNYSGSIKISMSLENNIFY